VSDYDRQQWQTEQAARDTALEAQRAREAKARERSARNAQRKLERLHRTLKDNGDLTEWEDEFAGSVQKRIDEFGSAFNDLQKGRPGDALSFAQKRVVAGLNKKVKDARKAAKASRLAGLEKDALPDAGGGANAAYTPRSSFKSKKPKFSPRVRRIEDDFEDAPPEIAPDLSPVPKPSPKHYPPLRSVPPRSVQSEAEAAELPKASRASDVQDERALKRPFLRLVKTGR
jgi:hypothetical protein